MKIIGTYINIVLIAANLWQGAVATACPSQKLNRKKQLSRLSNLDPTSVVVEAEYVGIYQAKHRWVGVLVN